MRIPIFHFAVIVSNEQNEDEGLTTTIIRSTILNWGFKTRLGFQIRVPSRDKDFKLRFRVWDRAEGKMRTMVKIDL